MKFKKDGFILIAMLLFLTIFSALAIALFESSMLEAKMEVSYEDKIRSFYLAEEKLINLEKTVLRGEFIDSDQVKQVDLGYNCNVNWYAVTSEGCYNGSITVLRSIVANGDPSSCDPVLITRSGRVFFEWWFDQK